MTPLSLFGRMAISDGDLDDVTASEGASITISNITVSNASVGVLSFGDSDGFTGYNSAGFMGTNSATIQGTVSVVNGTAVVDVGTSGSVTAVDLVLPTITLGTANVSSTMTLGSEKTLSSGKILGTLGLTGFSTRMTGEVQVFSHAAP